MKTIFRIHLPNGVGSFMGSPSAKTLDLNLSDIEHIEVIPEGKPPVPILSRDIIEATRILFPDRPGEL